MNPYEIEFHLSDFYSILTTVFGWIGTYWRGYMSDYGRAFIPTTFVAICVLSFSVFMIRRVFFGRGS